MQKKRYRIQFPQASDPEMTQDRAFFYLIDSSGKRKIRLHDYATIYDMPHLYEQIFYDRLKCSSPRVVSEILESTVAQSRECFSELRVLDLGAGNGMMGEALKKWGVARMVGVDIIPEAQTATERDRPDVYDAYYVADFCALDETTRKEIASWAPNCLTTVAALGFGDIPPEAFIEAFNILQGESWIAFNIKETFLDNSDTSGFSRTIRELIFSEYLDLYHLERYRHRLSVEGSPLYYYALAGRKNADIPAGFLDHALAGS